MQTVHYINMQYRTSRTWPFRYISLTSLIQAFALGTGTNETTDLPVFGHDTKDIAKAWLTKIGPKNGWLQGSK